MGKETWLLKIRRWRWRQRPRDSCFLGGKPALPPGTKIPTCELCGAEQTFFFQVAFPERHPWHGKSLAVFFCKACFDEEHIIPDRLKCPKGANVSSEFLRQYQCNFRLLVFPTLQGTLVESYVEKIAFRCWRAVTAAETKKGINTTKIGGKPHWLSESEAPGKLDGRDRFTFLLQIEDDFEFPRLPNSPPEIGFGRKPGEYELMVDFDFYALFAGSQLYMFGAMQGDEALVYGITQK